jgi:hypothetical protein
MFDTGEAGKAGRRVVIGRARGLLAADGQLPDGRTAELEGAE